MRNTIALVGNPNSGKTTLFNALTGANQHVGNWPGVTVEKKKGFVQRGEKSYQIVDLPGTYSLGAYSEDEIIARDFILKDRPDVVINVVDATNIERNLYLTTQLLEMDVKVVVALNMVDEAEVRQIKFDLAGIAKKLGVPVVPTIASQRKGIQELLDAALALINAPLNGRRNISYGHSLDAKISTLKGFLAGVKFEYPRQWLAVKVLEGDEYVQHLVQENEILSASREFAAFLAELRSHADHYQLEIVDNRYKFISGITSDTVCRPEEEVRTLTDKIDRIVTHKYFGLPIFALVMLAVFQLTFTIGEDLLGELAEEGVEFLGALVNQGLMGIQAPGWLTSFISDGVFGGVGEVVEFVPLIIIFYLLMGILEDSGYMARAAYVMDNIMRTVGLQGKSFVSMIVGFGCNVPGIMATRTLENKKDRMIAILINPFMSCSAKIPIYLIFIAAFFPKHGGLVMFALYGLGILMALAMAKILSKTLFRGETTDFIMELPPYRRPMLDNVVRNMWVNVSGFLIKAGTIILAVVSVLWLLAVLPAGVTPYGPDSILGQIGLALAPIFKPAGFGTWEAAVGLFSGIAAKETVVASLGMVYAGANGGTELVTALQSAFTPLTAVSFLVMTLLYTPCVATIVAIKNETGSNKWALFGALYTFAVGWVLAVAVYQLGSLLGFA